MQTKFYVGLDLHSTNTYVGVIDEQERRVVKGKFPNKLEVILTVLEPHQEHVVGVVVESTYNWYWLVDGLMDNGYKVHLAHPAAFQQYSGLKHTDDEHDAFFLAKMLKLGILPEGHIMPREERQLRDLLRKRMKLVSQRSTHILSFKSLLSRNLGFTMPSNEVKKLEDDEMRDWFDNQHLALSAKVNIAAMNNLKWQINEIQNTRLKAAKLKPQFEKLLSRARHRQHTGHDHRVGDRRYPALPIGRRFRFLLPLRQQPPYLQRQDQGQQQPQERQQVPLLRFRRGGEEGPALLPAGAGILHAQVDQDQQDRGHQSSGPQTGPGLFLHHARSSGFRRDEDI